MLRTLDCTLRDAEVLQVDSSPPPLCFSSDKSLPPTDEIICRNTFALEFKYPSLQKHYDASADAITKRRSATML